MPAIPPPSVVRAADGTVTITLSRPEVEALYDKGAREEPFQGSDEWDLNSAYQDGFLAGLDAIFHPSGR